MVASLVLALSVGARSQPGLGTVSWTHDLSVDTISLQYPGANASATARAYSIPPNTEVMVLVTVRNHSSNPSPGFRIDFNAGRDSIGSITGSSVPSQGEKQFSVKWKPVNPGPGAVEARLNITSSLPGANKTTCASCKSAKGSASPRYSSNTSSEVCSYPNSCTVGSMGSVCGCHPTADDPRNNSVRAAYQLGGDAPSAGENADGVDLQVDSCYLQASIVKMGTYEAFLTVSNRGTRPCSGMVDAEVTVGGNTRTVSFRGGIKAGEAKTQIVEFTRSGAIKVVVDPKNSVKEAKEDNNQFGR